MINKEAKTLVKKAQNYTWEDFEKDFQKMINLFNRIDEQHPQTEAEIRDELKGFNFSITQEEMYDVDLASATYVRFVEYKYRLNELFDQVNKKFVILSTIIQKVNEILPTLTEGTAKEKDAKSNIMLLEISMIHVQYKNLLSFLKDHKESIDFATTQLARILREKEATAKLNGRNIKRGDSHWIQNDQEVSTKPRRKP
jgi:hypothetical protein